MGRQGRPPGLWHLAARNLARQPGRTLTALCGVLLVAATAFAGGLISLGVDRALTTGLARLGADLMVVPKGSVDATHTALVTGQPVAFYMERQVADQVAAMAGVRQASPQIFVETLASSACCTGRLFLVGYDPETDFTIRPWIRFGVDRPLRPDEVVVGSHLYGLTGSKLQFYGSTFTIAARLDTTGMGIDETVFLPAPAVQAMARASATLSERPLSIEPDQISAVLVALHDPAQASAVAAAIESALPDVSVLTAGQVTAGVMESLAGLMALLLPLMGGVLAVALLLFVILFAAIAGERSREIGLLRAMGATARQALAALLVEAAVLGGLGGLAGVAAGWLIYALFKAAIMAAYTLPFLYPTPLQQGLLGAAIISLAALGASLSALVPASRLTRLDPHLAIHRR